MKTQAEGYPPDWVKLTVMVSPRGEIHAIDGDREDGDGDTAYIGLERLERRIERRWPWWRRDRFGWPIETVRGQWFQNAMRHIAQNIRKISPPWA